MNGSPDATPAAAHRPGLTTTAKIAIAVVGVVVIALIAVGGFGAFTIGAIASDHSKTVTVLDKVRTDNNRIGAELDQNPPINPASLSGSTPDFAGMQKAAQARSAQYVTSGATLTADRELLQTEDSRIKSQETSIQGRLARNQYESDRKRVESALTAFEAASAVIGIRKKQLAFYDKLGGALLTFQVITAKADDPTAALALYPPFDSALNSAANAASDPNVSPEFKTFTTQVKTAGADFKVLLEAVKAQDYAGVQAADAKIQLDLTELGKFDDNAYQVWQAALLKPYLERYNKGITGAGWTLVA